MSKPTGRGHSAREWTASVRTLQMSKPNVTRGQSATEWIASVRTLQMSKPTNVTRVQCYGMDCFGTYFTHVQT